MIKSKLVCTLLMGALFSIPASYAQAATTDMRNVLTITGEGGANPAYGRRIKNIMIFQAGGWSGLAAAQDCYLNGTPGCKNNPTWPLAEPGFDGGRIGYLSKSNSVLLHQMGKLKTLNQDTAIAMLIMPDEEATASGYGACWNSKWISATSCAVGGVWTKPKSLLSNVKWAAWMKGIQVAPLISINIYDQPNNPGRATVALQRLKSYVDWYMTTIDATTLKTTDGKVVILTEGLPSTTNISNDPQVQTAMISYMNSRTDIFWIDNLANTSPSAAGSNVYRSAATADATGSVQDSLKSAWGSRYLWHFLDRSGLSPDTLTVIPEPVRLKWLNISPTNPNSYPVIITQWNEYSEYSVFEPTERDNYAEYNYLQWRLSQQP